MTGRWKEGIRALYASAFALTAEERRMVCLILALALLGLGAKAWHQHRRAGETRDIGAQRQTE